MRQGSEEEDGGGSATDLLQLGCPKEEQGSFRVNSLCTFFFFSPTAFFCFVLFLVSEQQKLTEEGGRACFWLQWKRLQLVCYGELICSLLVFSCLQLFTRSHSTWVNLILGYLVSCFMLFIFVSELVINPGYSGFKTSHCVFVNIGLTFLFASIPVWGQ